MAAGAQGTLAQWRMPSGAEVLGRAGRWATRGEVCRAWLGCALGKPLGLARPWHWPCAREGWEVRLSPLCGLRPMANRKLEKAFLIFNFFLNSEPI
jgi:hypothetical protein